MATRYTTLRGPDYDPVPVEVWTWQGERVGKIGSFESMTFTVTGKPGKADTAELEVYLTELTALLIPCDGTYVIAAKYNGMTLLYAPVSAEVRNLDDDPSTAVVTLACSGAWSMLEGQITTPSFNGKAEISDVAEFEVTGSLETVIKRLLNVGQLRTKHPIIPLPSSGRGPRVSAVGAWHTVAEQIEALLTSNDYVLTLTGWVPGDPQPLEGYAINRPVYLADIRPYTPKPGLVWSHLSGDVVKWQVANKRAKATRVVASNGAEEMHEREIVEVQGSESLSPWSVREMYMEHKPTEDENMDPIRIRHDLETAATNALVENAPAVEVSATIENAAGWEFGTDGVTPRQYVVGDIAQIDLPVLGSYTQVITDVEVKITPDSLTVTPTVGTPDTLDLNPYTALAGVDKRLTRLERKG